MTSLRFPLKPQDPNLPNEDGYFLQKNEVKRNMTNCQDVVNATDAFDVPYFR